MRLIILVIGIFALASTAMAEENSIRFYPEAPKIATFTPGSYLMDRKAFWVNDEEILYRTFNSASNAFQLTTFNTNSNAIKNILDVGNGHYCYDPVSMQLLINVENRGLESQKSIWDSEYLVGKLGEPLQPLKINNPQFAKYVENRFDCSIVEKSKFAPPVNPPVVMPLRSGDGSLRVAKEKERSFVLTTTDGVEHVLPLKPDWQSYINAGYNRREKWYWLMAGNTNPVRNLNFLLITVNENKITTELTKIPPIEGSGLGSGIMAAPVKNGWALIDELLIAPKINGARTEERNKRNYNFYLKKNDSDTIQLVAQYGDSRIELLDVSPDGCRVAIKEYPKDRQWGNVEGTLGVWNVCQQ